MAVEPDDDAGDDEPPQATRMTSASDAVTARKGPPKRYVTIKIQPLPSVSVIGAHPEL